MLRFRQVIHTVYSYLSRLLANGGGATLQPNQD